MTTTKNPDPNSLVFLGRTNIKTTHSNGAEFNVEEYVPGLSKRELFAAMAMQGILANQREGWEAGFMVQEQAVAEDAVALADALIEELNKPKEEV